MVVASSLGISHLPLKPVAFLLAQLILTVDGFLSVEDFEIPNKFGRFLPVRMPVKFQIEKL
jgi:hypothetical protein